MLSLKESYYQICYEGVIGFDEKCIEGLENNYLMEDENLILDFM